MSKGTALARRIVTVIAVIAGAAAAGYVATCAIFPAPLLPRSELVPSLRTLPVDSAMMRLTRAGLAGRVMDTVADPLTPINTVAWQSPPSETALPAGSIVRLGLSGGSPLVAVPDVTALDLGLAREVLSAAGLRVAGIDTIRDAADIGTVVGTVPGPHATARPGDSLRISVSSGLPSVVVPDLIGMTVTAARERIAASGLRVGTLEQRFEGPVGTILAQRPLAGTLVIKESGVDLTISGTLP